MPITQPKQVFFLADAGGLQAYLPSEFCLVDGVPELIRRDSFKMRYLFTLCAKDPDNRFKEVKEFCKLLMSQKVFKEWRM